MSGITGVPDPVVVGVGLIAVRHGPISSWTGPMAPTRSNLTGHRDGLPPEAAAASAARLDRQTRTPAQSGADVRARGTLTPGPGSGQGLGLAVDEIVHHHDVAGGSSWGAIPTGDPHHVDTLAGIEPDAKE